MKRKGIAFLLLLLFYSVTSGAANLENGANLYKKCALCHGQNAQGIKGGLYPRLAGMPEYYTQKQMLDYAHEKRGGSFALAMRLVGGLASMTKKEYNDLSSYIASLDLAKKGVAVDIPQWKGNVEEGKDLYMGDCKICHGRKGQGKAKKDSPPLAGQYPAYLSRQIVTFMQKNNERYHDNDPEDDTFEDYKKEEINDILAFVSTLDIGAAKPSEVKTAAVELKEEPASKIEAKPMVVEKKDTKVAKKKKLSSSSGVKITQISQTVLQLALKEGVTPEDAITAMLSKSLELNMKQVGRQNVSAELKARGIDSPRLEIFQFCNPADAIKMVQHNSIYAAYMPCRIALVEDKKGDFWVEMLNLDMLINNFPLPEDLRKIAITINGQMLEIITAGSTGEF